MIERLIKKCLRDVLDLSHRVEISNEMLLIDELGLSQEDFEALIDQIEDALEHSVELDYEIESVGHLIASIERIYETEQ